MTTRPTSPPPVIDYPAFVRPTSPPPPHKRPEQIVIHTQQTVEPSMVSRLQALTKENARLQVEVEDLTDQVDDLKRTLKEVREQYGE